MRNAFFRDARPLVPLTGILCPTRRTVRPACALIIEELIRGAAAWAAEGSAVIIFEEIIGVIEGFGCCERRDERGDNRKRSWEPLTRSTTSHPKFWQEKGIHCERQIVSGSQEPGGSAAQDRQRSRSNKHRPFPPV